MVWRFSHAVTVVSPANELYALQEGFIRRLVLCGASRVGFVGQFFGEEGAVRFRNGCV